MILRQDAPDIIVISLKARSQLMEAVYDENLDKNLAELAQ